MPSSRLLSRLVSLGIVGFSVSLLALAFGTFLFPQWSSETYGLPLVTEISPSDSPSDSRYGWVIATGLRDGVIGLLALEKVFNRQGLLTFLSVAILLPLGDVAVVLSQSPQGWSSIGPHALGVCAIAALIGLVKIEQAKRSSG